MTRPLRWALLGAVVALLTFGVLRFEPDAHLLRPGQPLPPLRFATPSGAELDLAHLRGRLLVLNFWATWCAPCVAELPSLGRLQQQLGPSAKVVAVAVDDSVEEPRLFAAQHPLALSVAFDPGGRQARELLGVEVLPVSYVVDSDGVVREAHLGAREWDTPETLRRLRALSTSASTAPTR